jgi:hypothetical protein
MSYCRMNRFDSDVYMYPGGSDERDFIVCCGCRILTIDENNYPSERVFYTRSAAIKHLEKHQEEGDNVPHYAFERLREEIEKEGNEI